jgi:DnaJ-class molecular chaperone
MAPACLPAGRGRHELAHHPAMTAHRTDLYTVLGLTSQATQAQVRHAYRALVRRHHPDTREPGTPTDTARADEALQHVIAAYAVLGEPDRRAAYDQCLDPRRATAPTRVGPLVNASGRSPQRQPIRVGPVRWHRWPQ